MGPVAVRKPMAPCAWAVRALSAWDTCLLISLGFAPEKQNHFIAHIHPGIFVDSACGIRNSVSHKHNGCLEVCRGRIEYGKVIGADQGRRRVGCE